MNGTEIEIVAIPELTDGQDSLMDLHSVLNLLNVIHGELTVMGLELADDPELMNDGLKRCESMKADLMNPAASLRHIESLPETKAEIDAIVAATLVRFPQQAELQSVQESVGNIAAVFQIFEVRAREILARKKEPGKWVEMSIDDIQADFQSVFAAMEKHSHGRYRILCNLAMQESNDYFVDFAVQADEGRDTIAMPLIFKDVMRDLIANARKYSPLGSSIIVGLYESSDSLKFVVQDTGRGIPASEIKKVFEYGERGSNVEGVRTMGGGFGLTKAFYITKQFGGRFWITSEVDQGTRIRIELPRPS